MRSTIINWNSSKTVERPRETNRCFVLDAYGTIFLVYYDKVRDFWYDKNGNTCATTFKEYPYWAPCPNKIYLEK